MKKLAALRVCASCEWIFKLKRPNQIEECPKCRFGSYGAYYVYGSKCYRFKRDQKPWMDKKLFAFECKLRKEILESVEEVEEAEAFGALTCRN